MRLQAPAHHLTTKQINHRCQIQACQQRRGVLSSSNPHARARSGSALSGAAAIEA